MQNYEIVTIVGKDEAWPLSPRPHFMKTVVGIAGLVIIDGKPLPFSHILRSDAEGRAMPVFADGIVSEDMVFLHSDFTGSYDSRYFGLIPTSGALGHAREILTFAPASDAP